MTRHPNEALIERLFAALDRHDAASMASCYCEDGVVFHDIAFHIEDAARLHAMWRMVCEGESGIRVTIRSIRAEDRECEAQIVDRYQFGRDAGAGKAGRPVVNEITSRFTFRDGLIARQEDFCDSRAWAAQAMGGAMGWVAGRCRPLRAWSAKRKLDRFMREHPAPRGGAPAP